MRTKALLCLAATAAMLTSAVAQNVYSVNVVGYVNVTLQAGKLHYLSIPVAPMDGNFNLNNTIPVSTMPSSQNGATIWNWIDGSWAGDFVTYYDGAGWYNTAGEVTITNGVGFFLSSMADSVLTFVGEVPQSSVAPINYDIPIGGWAFANKVPVTGNWPGATTGQNDDNMWTWDQVGQSWRSLYWTFYDGYGWSDSSGTPEDVPDGPVLNPAEGVFYLNKGSAMSFSRTFTVAP